MKPSKRALFGLVAALAAMVSAQPAPALAGTGAIKAIRVSGGIGGTAVARVSIEMYSDTRCENNGWYAFEPADKGIGKAWTDALLAAYTQRRQITIHGTGTCDEAGVERIDYIDFHNY